MHLFTLLAMLSYLLLILYVKITKVLMRVLVRGTRTGEDYKTIYLFIIITTMVNNNNKLSESIISIVCVVYRPDALLSYEPCLNIFTIELGKSIKIPSSQQALVATIGLSREAATSLCLRRFFQIFNI